MSIGTRIVLEGEKEYRKAISDVNSSMRVLKSELRAVSAEFDGNANSVDALGKKNEILNKQQKEQEKAIRLLKGALESATKEFGENSKQAQNWQIKLNNAQTQLSKLNRELDDNEKYLKEAKSSTDKTAKSIDEFGKEIKDASGETKIFGDVLKANLASDAIRDGLRKLGDLMVDLIEDSKDLASDLQEVQNVVDVTFGDSSGTIDDWADTLGDVFGMSELRGKEFAGTFGAMLKSADITGNELIETTQKVIERTADLASFYNSDLPNAFTKARSVVTGETEPLKQWGINMAVANLEAYALKEGLGKLYSEMEQGEQVMTRINYFLKATADAQGDFTRNIDSQANQERIMQLQREEMLKRFGDAILPAVTRATMKFNEATKDMGGDMAKTAGVLADGIVDALVWIMDNSDTVIAGLKGIAIAIPAKKAGDGLAYIIKAYKDLTRATEEATVAQIANNTATKANIYVAIASAIIGISTALFSYVKNARDAADETEKLNSESYKLIESSKKLNEEIENSRKKRLEDRDAIIAQSEGAKQLAESLYELADKEKKTSEEKEQMLALTKQLNETIPDLNLSIDEQTGLLNLNKDALSDLIEKQLEYNMVVAAQEDLQRIATERYETERQLTPLLEDQIELEKEKNEAQEKYLKEAKIASRTELGWTFDLSKADRAYAKIRELYNENVTIADPLKEKLETLNSDYEYALDYIGKYGKEFETAGNALDSFGEKYKKVLDEQTQAEVGTLEDRQKQIGTIYKETSKELDKLLKEDLKKFEKAKEKEVELEKESAEKKIEKAKEVYDKEIDFIKKKYLIQKSAVDDEFLPGINSLQQQIDDIETQAEAEDRAIRLREEAEKRAELVTRIETAKTLEERLEAQTELKEYDEKIGRERIKEERKLNIEILEDKKEQLQSEYEEKLKTLEDTKKSEEEAAEEVLASKKLKIEEALKTAIETLKERQEVERESLREEQTDYKDHLQELKELAITNSKEIYEEDLAKFKMNQALKYEEAVSSEAQMKKAIQEYAYKSLPPGQERDTILKSNDLNEMLRYYNPSSAINSSVPQAASIDYSLIEEAMTRAIKKADTKVYLDRKVVGSFVEDKVNSMLRR